MVEVKKSTGPYTPKVEKDGIKYQGWRPELAHADRRKMVNAKPAAEKQVIPAVKFFDQLSWIGDEGVGCWVVETSEGLILIDCMRPGQKTIDIIEQGFKDLGYDIHDLKAILITHGHFDHYGVCGYLQEKYGCGVYISEADYHESMDPIDTRHKHFFEENPYKCTHFIEDGESLVLGDMEIHAIGTPGHSPGCLSFIFRVTDEGREHWVGMWGGTGIAGWELKYREQYLLSLIKFASITHDFGCDVEISSHPFVDNATYRLDMCRNIVVGPANPFVIGKEGFQRYLMGYATLCHD